MPSEAPERIALPDLDVHGAARQYVGAVAVSIGMLFRPRPSIRDDVVVAVAEDDAGTIMVKHHPVVVPEER